jgi:outer membrane protein assembly factor BamA
LKPYHILLFTSLFFVISNVVAQDFVENDSTSSEELPKEEIDSIPEKKSFFHKIFNQTKPVTYLAFPLVSYTPETNLMLGLGGVVSFRIKNDTNTASSYIIPWLTYSIDKQMNAEIFGSFYHKSNKHQLDFEMNYKIQKQPYYGIGNKLDFDNKELVYTKGFRFYSVYQNRIKDVFVIGPVYHIDYTTTVQPVEKGLLDTTNVIGKDGGFVQGLGLKVAFDNRDDVYFPYKGNYLAVSGVGYPNFMGSKYQFATVQAEYRSFINIKRKVIFASQIMSQMSFGDIPFYLMPKLGGDKLLRGYTAGTSRDKFLFNLQGELRVPISRFILSGFFGGGIAGDEFMDYFNVKEYSYSIGGGVRFKPFTDKNIVLRLDAGFWQKTFGFYFVFNEAF